MDPVPIELLVVLAALSLLAGVGCTTLGAGGIFVTIALYALAPLSPPAVAGTAHVGFVGVGIVGAVAYSHSGELLGRDERLLAILLGGSSVVGSVTGAAVNPYVSEQLFSILLGSLTVLTGCTLVYGQRRGLTTVATVDSGTRRGRFVFGTLGLFLGLTSGLVGIGGPVFAVPAMVLLGIPMLVALGVAQVQAIFISGVAASSYGLQGVISPLFAAVTAVPLVVGAIGGWLIAHRVDPARLELLLGIVLLSTGIYVIA